MLSHTASCNKRLQFFGGGLLGAGWGMESFTFCFQAEQGHCYLQKWLCAGLSKFSWQCGILFLKNKFIESPEWWRRKRSAQPGDQGLQLRGFQKPGEWGRPARGDGSGADRWAGESASRLQDRIFLYFVTEGLAQTSDLAGLWAGMWGIWAVPGWTSEWEPEPLKGTSPATWNQCTTLGGRGGEGISGRREVMFCFLINLKERDSESEIK